MGKVVAAVDLEECNVSRRIDRDDVGSIALPVVGNKFDFLAVCCDVAVSHRITISWDEKTRAFRSPHPRPPFGQALSNQLPGLLQRGSPVPFTPPPPRP